MSDFGALPFVDRGGKEPTVRFAVRVQPRSSRAGVDGMHDGALRVRVNASPVEGAANDAVMELLAKTLGVPKRAVTIVSGAKSRSKLVEVSGLSAAEIRTRLTLAEPSVW